MVPTPSPDKPGISIAEVERLLARLGNLTDEIVLVSGKAVNFWVFRQEGQAAEFGFAWVRWRRGCGGHRFGHRM